LTAAHTTLPMPSIVQVTDLENGRSLQLRVNDRGPFVDGRMIDVSRRAAQLLGFEQKGTAVVRVTVLKEESIAAAEDAMRNRGQVMVAQASNTATAPPPAPSYQPAAGPSSRLAALPAPKPAPPTVAMAGPARGSVAPSPPAAGTAAPRPAPVAVAPVVVAANEPPPKPLPPPRPRSLFSLIARAEAAELPPDFAVPRKKAAASTAIAGSARLAAAPHTASSSRPVFVQAGAFANRSNALRAEARIARLGSVHVAAAAINGVAVYRVRLGPVGSHEQAKILLNRVVDSGFREARIVGD
jgi:rare lipoprotein A